MALLRLLSAAAELTGAFLIYRVQRVDTALRVNAVLGLVGPVVLLLVTALGIAGLIGRLSPTRLALLVAGTLCIVLATRR
ncbi:MAG: DUF2619 domain-containing protein [Clostridia bacterium]|nr:DUF2619 domain-containing protein [Clostridia bacterium]